MDEHRRNAIDFIEATRWVRTNLPYVSVSGGVSNVSFSFRGNDERSNALCFPLSRYKSRNEYGNCKPTMLEVYDEIQKIYWNW
jgi:5-methyltetrahydrofolate--homocysteine methyltransferase